MRRGPVILERESELQVKFTKRHTAPRDIEVKSHFRQTVVRGGYVAPQPKQAQNVFVKISYRGNYNGITNFKRAHRDNLKYLTRDGHLNGFSADADGLTLNAMHKQTADWGNDNRFYKIIVAAEMGYKMDQTQHARETMKLVEKDLLTDEERKQGLKIEWIAVQHWDTNQPHYHIEMRARVGDRELRISDGYASHGFQARAREAATNMLGYRTSRGVDIAEKHSVIEAKRQELGITVTDDMKRELREEMKRNREVGIE